MGDEQRTIRAGIKEKTLAVKQLVETCLDGYAMLHEIAKMKVVYPEEKLQEKIIAGEIDPSDEIPIDEQGTTVTPVEFIQGFNEQAREAISYDPEFGEKVRPAMERVFAKRGWGMTDEQYLLYMFGKDLAFKGVQVTVSLVQLKPFGNRSIYLHDNDS